MILSKLCSIVVSVGALTGLVGPLTAPDEVAGDLVPVLSALRPLVPSLRPGMVVSVTGAASLGLALLAGAAQGGGWSAVVGVPELGVLAAKALGADPERLLLVDEPGERWPEVVAALSEAVRLVLVRPPSRPTPTLARRLTAMARKHGCVLAVSGEWEGANIRLHASDSTWQGLEDGHGQLRSRLLKVTADGRGSAAQGRSTWLLLPDSTGRAATVPEPARHLEVVA